MKNKRLCSIYVYLPIIFSEDTQALLKAGQKQSITQVDEMITGICVVLLVFGLMWFIGWDSSDYHYERKKESEEAA